MKKTFGKQEVNCIPTYVVCGNALYTIQQVQRPAKNCPDAQFVHTPIGETYGWVATVAPRAEEETFRSGLYI